MYYLKNINLGPLLLLLVYPISQAILHFVEGGGAHWKDAIFVSLLVLALVITKSRLVSVPIGTIFFIVFTVGVLQVIGANFFKAYIDQKVVRERGFVQGLFMIIALPAGYFNNGSLKLSSFIEILVFRIALPAISLLVIFSKKGPLALHKEIIHEDLEAPVKTDSF